MAFLSKLFKGKSSAASSTTNSGQASTKAAPKPPVSQPLPDLNALALDQLVNALIATPDAGACLAALGRLSLEADFVSIAAKHPTAAVRMAAAEQVQSYEALQQLHNLIKGKDKAVLRLCKDRLNVQRELHQEQQARQQRISYLLAQTKLLNKLGYQPEFSGKLQLLKQEWADLQAEAQASVQNELNQELQQAEQVLAQYAAQEAAVKAQQQAAKAAQSLQQELSALASSLLETAHQELYAPLAEQVHELTARWDEALRQHQPAAELARSFEQSLQQLLSVQTSLKHYQEVSAELEQWLQQGTEQANAQFQQAQQWLKNIQWPAGINAPLWYEQLKTKAQALQGYKSQQQQQQKELISRLEQQLKQLSQALQQGQVKEANKLNQHISQALKQLPAQAASHLRKEQQALFAKLQEMRDWADYAILPKKEALVSAMQELVGSSVAPDVLADKIHALQEEWKTLSHAGVRDNELWQAFSQAADHAFEPCKAYFAQQAEIRAQLTAAREALINELRQYEQSLDWANADWALVQKTLDTARDTFRTLGPIERAAHSKTQEQFHAVCDRIYAHLKGEYERNLERKQALVNEAQALLNSDKLQGVVDKVKALQAQWKTVGVTPRAGDQKLWKQFRTHCDEVFKRLDEQRQERKAEINEAISAAQSTVTAALRSGEAPALKEASQYLHSVSLPKAIFAELSKQLQDAQQSKQQAAKQQQQAGLLARLQHLTGSTEDWQNACALPLPADFNASLFEQARAGQLSSTDNARDLCILLEIVMDKTTPAADQARRMELQVQRLAEGLGKGFSHNDEVRLLVERWLAVQASSELTARFMAALQ